MDIIVIVVSGILGLILAGVVYEAVFTAMDRRRYKNPPGKRIDVGGHRLHIHIMGERQPGQPAIIFDAGIGGNSLDWELVQPGVAGFAQSVTYDRAGYGWSEPGPKPRTPQRIVEEWHTLLDKAGIAPPYILVGHSFGGLHARLFAEQFPDDVAGIVLVDSSHPQMLSERNTEPEIRRLRRVARFKRIGFLRLLLPRMMYRANHLPGDSRKRYLAFNLLDSNNVIHEAWPMFEDGVALSEAVNVPLTVVSRAPTEEISSERLWHEYQQKLVELSPDAKHLISEKGSHYIALADPHLVINAIKDMLEGQGDAKE